MRDPQTARVLLSELRADDIDAAALPALVYAVGKLAPEAALQTLQALDDELIATLA
jgi:hypothetical protein